jgi:hypothetical protein
VQQNWFRRARVAPELVVVFLLAADPSVETPAALDQCRGAVLENRTAAQVMLYLPALLRL